MSADNMICIQKRVDGKWWVWMDFASNDAFVPRGCRKGCFDSEVEAMAFASGWLMGESIVEYGINHLPPEEKSDRVGRLLCKLRATVDDMYVIQVTQGRLERATVILRTIAELCGLELAQSG
ncbi:MAG: hypothetical protein ACXABY_33795 [Candidatus Thorarchaeota archaeon]